MIEVASVGLCRGATFVVNDRNQLLSDVKRLKQSFRSCGMMIRHRLMQLSSDNFVTRKLSPRRFKRRSSVSNSLPASVFRSRPRPNINRARD